MKVKGSALRSSMNYLREHYTTAQVERVLGRLAEEQRSVVERPLLTASWYEASVLYDLMHAMAAETPGDPGELFRTLGRQSCDDGLNTVYKVFFKVGTPSFMLKFTIQVWSNYYSEGKMVKVEGTAQSALLRLEGLRPQDEAMCHRVTGWLERALELSGAQDIHMLHEACARRGAAACEWKGVWK
jgi:hypothetical protein